MRFIFLVLSFLFIAGCTTPNGMREQKPIMELTSQKTSQQIAICIADKWDNLRSIGMPISMRNIKDGYMITAIFSPFIGPSRTVLLADVTEKINVSTTVYYRENFGLGDYDEGVTQCQ